MSPAAHIEVKVFDLEETQAVLRGCGQRILALEAAIGQAIEAGVGCDGKCPPRCTHLDAMAALDKALKVPA